MIGAPGHNEWSGAVIQYEFHNNENKLINFYHIGINSYAYFGYAVTLGKFFYDGQVYCASSAPRMKSIGAVSILILINLLFLLIIILLFNLNKIYFIRYLYLN